MRAEYYKNEADLQTEKKKREFLPGTTEKSELRKDFNELILA